MDYLTHKIELAPTKKQQKKLLRSVNASRTVYNWGVETNKKWYAAWKLDNTQPFPTLATLDKAFNQIKASRFKWITKTSKWIRQEALKNVFRAISNFAAGRARYPRFHSVRSARQTAYVRDIDFKSDNRVHIPKIGKVKLKEKPRWPYCVILHATIIRESDRWFLSVLQESAEKFNRERGESSAGKIAGIDLGVRNPYTIVVKDSENYTEERVEAPWPLEKNLRRLRIYQRSLSRAKYDGKNFQKICKKLRRLYWRISNIRKDAIHKLTSRLCRDYETISIEDLRVTGMLRGNKRTLSRRIMDLSFFEFKRQLKYKAPLHRVRLVIAPQNFPSTKLCNVCGVKNTEIKRSDLVFKCSCGVSLDRDTNASINLIKFALASGTAGSAGTNDFGLRGGLAPVHEEVTTS